MNCLTSCGGEHVKLIKENAKDKAENAGNIRSEKFKNGLSNIKSLILLYLEDILIASGLATIVTATFQLSFIAGLYCMGGVQLLLGAYFAVNPLERRQNK